MKNPVIIFGASGLAQAAKEIFESNDIVTYCFLDDDKTLHNTEIDGISVLGSMDDDGFLKLIGKKCEAFVAIDEKAVRSSVVNMLNKKRKVMPVNAIHGTAIISRSAHIGYGNFINMGAKVGNQAKVPNHCIVHAGATIDYNVEIEDFVQIGSGSNINSGVQIGKEAFIGSGATIVSGVKIGEGARIGAGSVVIADVDKNETVFGNPATKVDS